MTSVLKDWGYDVDGFIDPLEALSALIEKKYDMVFSELKMSNLDGYKLLYRFNKEKPDQKCCLVTGALNEEVLLKKTIRLPNVKGLIKKPINIEDLRHILEKESKGAQC